VPLTPLFDFDGTLVDSDAALIAPFLALGLTHDELPPLGLPLADACASVGITVEAYVERYDHDAAQPFPGAAELLAGLPRWGLASNKQRAGGHRELARLGWTPAAALFSDDFGGAEKQLAPLLEILALAPSDAVYIGDTAHDRACAGVAGVPFALAGWNPRARAGAQPGDHVLDQPADVLDLLRSPA
jgi:phosphoglycolate phosphatase-like HAD superfamily hydrolase